MIPQIANHLFCNGQDLKGLMENHEPFVALWTAFPAFTVYKFH